MSLETISAPAALGDGARLQLPIEGMHCASCVGRIEKAVAAVPGVASVAVNLATERADVRFAGPAEPAPVISAIRAAGFDVRQETLDLQIEGMHCASCVARTEKELRAVPGVIEANVNLATERAHVSFSSGTAQFGDLARAVEKAGYHAHPVAEAGSSASQHHHHEEDAKKLGRDTLLAALLTAPVFIVEMTRISCPPFICGSRRRSASCRSISVSFC